MTWFLAGAGVLCAGVSLWALGEGKEMWCAFWALMALVNAISCKMSLTPVPVEAE